MSPVGKSIIATTTFFTIGDSTYDATDWVNYANTYRYKQDGTGAKPWPQVMDEFEKFEMLNYYRDHLEDFNKEFRSQMAEFKDGNIFFEIMQQEVWNQGGHNEYFKYIFDLLKQIKLIINGKKVLMLLFFFVQIRLLLTRLTIF